MTREQVTEMLLQQGFDCGQVVLYSVADRLGLSKENALRLAAGFGGGMFAGETCGAVTGALIALGYRYGHCKAGDWDTKAMATEKAKEFRARFAEATGSTVCQQLLGYNIGDPEEYRKILELELMQQRCPGIVYEAIRLLDELL